MRPFAPGFFVTACFFGLFIVQSLSYTGKLARRDNDEVAVSSNENEQGSTTYNGVKVPAMMMLNGETFADDIKTGYW